MGKNYILYILLFILGIVHIKAQSSKEESKVEGVFTSVDSIRSGTKNFESTLAGKVNGLQVTERGGMPGQGSQLTVAGFANLNGDNTPLFVIDGLIIDYKNELSNVIDGHQFNYLNELDANDIESVQYLKGAAALIYGSQAGKGVIVIKTKQSKSLEPKINFSTSLAVSSRYRGLDMLSADEYKFHAINLYKSEFEMYEIEQNFPNLFLNTNDRFYNNYNNNTNWSDEIYRKSFSQAYKLNVEGGDAIANYALTVGYNNDQGIIDNTKLEKYFMRFNAAIKVSKAFSIDVNANLMNFTSDLTNTGYAFESNPIISAYAMTPMLAPNEIDNLGTIQRSYAKVANFNRTSNPVALLNDNSSYAKGHIFSTLVRVNHSFAKHFSHNLMLGYNLISNRENNFISGMTNLAVAPIPYFDGTASNMVKHGITKKSSLQFQYQLGYNNKEILNGLNATVGARYRQSNVDTDYGVGINTSSDDFITLQNVNPSYPRIVRGSWTEQSMIQTFLNANLDINKFVGLQAWLNFDGTSNVGENADQYGLFYGASLPITLLNSTEGVLNYFTIRPETFKTANMDLKSYQLRHYYQSNRYDQIAGLKSYNLIDNDLSWEDVYGYNVTATAKLLNAVTLTGTYYQNSIKNMLVTQNVEASNGFAKVLTNGGEKKSRGLNLGLSTNFKINQLSLGLYANVTNNVDEITKLPGNHSIITDIPHAELISEVGSALYQFYGYKVNKVISSDTEAQQLNLVNEVGEAFQAGDIAFEDVDGNNIIDENDKQVIGDPNPDYFGGFGLTSSWKRLKLDVNFSYSMGADVYNYSRMITEGQSQGYNQAKSTLAAWMIDGQETDMPRAVLNDPMDNNRFSSRYIEDGSYIKLKHVGLSYNFDIKNSAFKSFGVSLDGYNLWLLSDYKGLDPEFSYSDNPMYQGVDYGQVPNAATVMLGLRVGF